MAERVAPGLRPHAGAVRSLADLDAGEQLALVGVDRVELAVVAPGEPEDLAVGGDAAHVGAPAARDPPGAGDLARREVDERDRALPAVRDVEVLRVAAGV